MAYTWTVKGKVNTCMFILPETECYQSQDSKQELLYCLSSLTEQDDLPENMYIEKKYKPEKKQIA